MKTPTTAVRCSVCKWKTARTRRDDGGFGVCAVCGGRLDRRTSLGDRRAAVAKADLARYERRLA